LLLNFALEYATRKVHENYDGLKLHGTHQLVDDTNVGKKNTVRKNIDHLLVTKKEEGTAVNARKITYVLISQ
jgi:hypothetical protein